MTRLFRRAAVAAVLILVSAHSPRAAGQAPPSATVKFPLELVELFPYQHNPVFTGRGTGFWDERIRERGWILRDEQEWRMWYTGYQPGGQMKLGYATSPDGITWSRRSDPIYDQHWVEDMMVVRHGGTYYMFAEGLNDRAQLLTSADGVAWQRQGTLDVRRANGQPLSDGPFGTPTALFAENRWWLMYERGDQAVWLASSDDLKLWTNVQDEPVLRPGPAAYDSRLIAVNQIVAYHDRYYLYYHGLGDTNGNWTTNIASSTDLRNWSKYANNPLRPAGENKSSGILLLDGNQVRLYTMHNRVELHFPRR
jgi:predicted GH43/DUF377 family glycosyl hydrolase